MSDNKALDHLRNLVYDGNFFEWYTMKAKDVSYEASEEFKAANKYFLEESGTVVVNKATVLASVAKEQAVVNKATVLASVAKEQAEKNFTWTGGECEAEKYLASVRKAVGQPKGRFPWCGAFVYWCCRKAQIDVPSAFPTGFTAAYVPGWEAWARANKTWYSSRLKASEFNPKAGDIVVFDWNDDAVADHIGIVLDYDGKRTLTTAEGNTSATNNSNGNSTAIRTRDWNLCKGFIRLA